MIEAFYRIYSIEKETRQARLQHFESEDNIADYIRQIIEENGTHHDRRYKFRDDDTYFSTAINNLLVNGVDIDQQCQEIADRLLAKETEANNRIRQTNKSIPPSFLIISLITGEGNNMQMLFIKADKTNFINTASGNLDVGLPAKRKIFKSCVFTIAIQREGLSFTNVISHDANSQGKAVYWYHDFLCLDEQKSDEANTRDAYKQIKKKILDPIKKDHPHDYINMRNAIIHYMRSDGDFDTEQFRDDVIGGFHPFDEDLDIRKLKDKVNAIFEDGDIDRRFQKVTNVITEKFKDNVKLTNDIELHLLQDIPNASRLIKAGEDDGHKYIKIYSEEGYKYAEGLARHNQ